MGVLAFLRAELANLLLVAVAAIALAGVVAPLRTLRWWGGRARALGERAAAVAPGGQPGEPVGDRFLVYVPGVDSYSRDWMSRRESGMLELLQERVPGVVIIRDVFAYDVEGSGLPSTPLRRLWLWLHNQRLQRGRLAVLGNLILFRNVLQVAISADPRYGPVYNYGVAEAMIRALLRHGYSLDDPKPVTLAGYSGGGQLALGAARYLGRALGAPVSMISIGGVMSDDPGILEVRHLYHLYGDRDLVHRLGLLWAGRWPVAFRSSWNRAAAAGRISRLRIGPMKHNGRRSYYDRTARMPDGRTYLEATTAAVASLL